MLDKLAVLIAGEYRTWDIAKRYILDFSNSLSNDVDYYFVTWCDTSEYWKNPTLQHQRTKVIEDNVRESFRGKNLIGCRLEPLVDRDNSYYLRAHLSKIANVLKRRHELEHDFIYNQVVEIRPDVYIPVLTKPLIKCCDYEYSIGEVYTHYQELPSIPDLYFRTSSAGNDVLATRNNYNKFNYIKDFNNLPTSSLVDFEPFPSSRDLHYLLLDFLMNKRMIALKDQRESERATVVRPNFPANFGDLSIEEIRELYHQYQKYVDNL